MMITIEMLERMPSGDRACALGRSWFKENFPCGGKLEDVWDACTAWQWRGQWQVWFAMHTVTADTATEFARSCAARAATYAVVAAEHARAEHARADAAAAHAEACAYASAAAEAACAAHDAEAEDLRDYNTIIAARGGVVAHYEAEVQAQIAWAHKVLFG